jgi:hypothetical protein
MSKRSNAWIDWGHEAMAHEDRPNGSAGRGFRVGWFRTRATFADQWLSYLSIVLLVGLIGGIAMASVAAARRTQSSFSTFIASTNPSDLTIAGFPNGPAAAYSPALTQKVRSFPNVMKVESIVQPFAFPLGGGDVPLESTSADLTPLMSVDGLDLDIDRAAVIAGRLPGPDAANEFVTTALGAKLMGWRLNEVVPFGFYSETQLMSPKFGTAGVPPIYRDPARLVGIVQLSDGVIQDQVDQLPTFAIFPPATTRKVLASKQTTSYAVYYGLQLRDHGAGVPTAEAAFQQVDSGLTFQFHVTSSVVAKSDRAIRPDSIALGIFGGIAGLAALVIAAQAIGRYERRRANDLEMLSALGAQRDALLADALLPVTAAIFVGSLLAFGVATALSPLGPIGPVRAVYPGLGVAIDWTVLGLGSALLALILGGSALLSAFRVLPRHGGIRRDFASGRPSVAVTAASSAGLGASAVIGIRFALDKGVGRNAVPIRSTLVGMALAVAVVTSTLTFGSGLATLVAHPRLYGWNWTYALVSENAPDVPPQAYQALQHDPDVQAVSGATIADPTVNHEAVPSIFEAAGSVVDPPLLSGHGIENNDEVVLGAETMAELHEHIGGHVTFSFGSPATAPLYVAPKSLKIVGTATMPALGFPSSEGDHTSMGTGALVPNGVISAALKKALQSPIATLNGPELVFVRMRPNVTAKAALADMNRIAAIAARAFAAVPHGEGTGDTVTIFPEQRPAEIENYRSIGAAPALLAAGLAVGAVGGFAVTLVSSLRRRRRDFAILKALGFSSGQLFGSVAIQASVIALIGLVVGIPGGIALGRWLWILFAREIYAVPDPTVPVLWLAIVCAATFVLVNLVAALPARSAARTATALVLRSE